ncbi:unnamed protein product [Boreogadus saida]
MEEKGTVLRELPDCHRAPRAAAAGLPDCRRAPPRRTCQLRRQFSSSINQPEQPDSWTASAAVQLQEYTVELPLLGLPPSPDTSTAKVRRGAELFEWPTTCVAT